MHMTNYNSAPQGSDFSAINAAHRQAEKAGLVSPNRLPSSIPIEQAFAAMDGRGLVIEDSPLGLIADIVMPALPPNFRGHTNNFGRRGHTIDRELPVTERHSVKEARVAFYQQGVHVDSERVDADTERFIERFNRPDWVEVDSIPVQLLHP